MNENIDRIEQEENEMQPMLDLLALFLRKWKFIAFGVVVALVPAWGFLRYSTPVYQVHADIKLKEESRGSSPSAISIEDIANIGAVSNVSDEAEVIKSRSIVRRAIKQLNLQTSYIVEGRIKSSDLYDRSPVIVSMGQHCLDSLTQDIDFVMTMEGEHVRIKGVMGEQVIDTLFTELPALMQTEQGPISFVRRPGIEPLDKPVEVNIAMMEKVLRHYRSNMTVQPMGGARVRSNLMTLTINTPYPAKGQDFLTEVIDVYNNEMIADKNMEASNTQRFINERIAIINEELSSADLNVEAYKREQGLTDMQSDLQRDMQMGSKYEQTLVQVETQMNVVSSLNTYVNDPANANLPVPSNIGIDDPTLVATANEYNRLLLERERMAQSMTAENPMMRRLDEQISGLRSSINSSIHSVQQGLQIQRRDAQNQVQMFGGRLGSMPKQEREFMDLTREQQIKQNLFLMLLQKREENALALAATSNTAKIINEAVRGAMVFPKTKIIYLAALLLGLLIPAGMIYLYDLLQFKVKTRSDVDRLSRIEILGDIPRHDKNAHLVVSENSTEEVNEAFRILRTNLVLSMGAEQQVALFTSTVPGEGKTFMALNTAASIALLDKKVLLIGADLRLPRLHEYLNIDKRDGLSNYLSGFEKDYRNLISKSEIPGLDVLHAGPIPPNPAELLSRNTLDNLIGELRQEYDYILIDTAPVSLVTDTLTMDRISDTTVYVTRAGYSRKGNIKFANQMQAQRKLKNMLLVVNDVKDYYHGYGYGYGYGYGAQHKKKKGLFGR